MVIERLNLGEKIIKKGELERFRVIFENLYSSGEGLHSGLHAARVLVLASKLGLLEGLDSLGEVQLAAVIHDSQRKNDGYDWFHGKRASRWVRENLSGQMLDINLKEVEDLCLWHVIPDKLTPRDLVMWKKMRVFEDADALDRYRNGDLNLRFLRTENALLMVNLAREFIKVSEEKVASGINYFDAVMDAGVEIGLMIQ